jgi:hypothetical protein
MRPRRLLREVPEPPREVAVDPSGKTAVPLARSQTRPKLHCLPSTFGSGTPKRLGREAKRPIERSGGATRAAASERVDPKPKGASSGRAAATSRASQRTPRWKKALRSTSRVRAPWRHGRGHGSNGERERQSVNATASERTPRGDGMVRLPRRGTLRRVSATGDDSPRTFGSNDLRVAVRSRGRARESETW